MTRHRYNSDSDRCVCGGVVVYFEPDDAGVYGEGCEVDGHVWAMTPLGCVTADLSVPENGHEAL